MIRYSVCNCRSQGVVHPANSVGVRLHSAQGAHCSSSTQERGVLASPPSKKGRPLKQAIIDAVQAFYRSEEISRQMPGGTDHVTVRQLDGSKVQVQKKLVLFTLKEAHQLYCSDYPPEMHCSFGKFASLRPQECILPDSNSGCHTVCVCSYHENVKLMFDSVKHIFACDAAHEESRKRTRSAPPTSATTGISWRACAARCPAVPATTTASATPAM